MNDAVNSKAFEQAGSADLLQTFFSKYLAYWPLFLLLTVLGAGSAWLYLRYQKPLYQASSTILIKDDKADEGSKIMNALNQFGSKKVVENEIEVLRTRSIAQKVAKNLGLYAPVMEKGKFVDRSAYVSSPVQIEAAQPDSLTPVQNVSLRYDAQANAVFVEGQRFSLNAWVATKYGELKFTANKHYKAGSQQGDLYFSLLPVQDVANNLLSALKVEATSKQSTVLNLTFTDEVRQRGEDVLNDLMAEYNKSSVNDKNTLAANTLAFIEDRLQYLVRELDSVETNLERFRTKNKVIDISSQGRLYLENVGANDQRISDFSVQRAVLDQVENYVQGKTGKSGIVPSTLGVNDPVLSQLLQTLYDTELQYEKLKSTVPENNPMIVSLRDQINKIKPGILENINTHRKSLQAGEADLYATNSRYTSLLQTLPEKERALLEISRQQNIKNNIYTFLLQKREETGLSYASAVADSRLLDKAASGAVPVSPVKSVVYVAFVSLAIFLGILFVFIREATNRNVASRSEVARYLTLPILGEIALGKSRFPIAIEEGTATVVAEQFRKLRTSLRYVGFTGKYKKKLLVTSGIAGEGKSFVAVNLGISMALAGKKVVLLELDLRNPGLHNICNVAGETGLTNYFIGEKDAEEIIRKTKLHENLCLVPSGPVPPNPSELMLNGRLQSLLAYLEEIFDCIIMDAAPVAPVTDAYILSPLCDATLYVVRQGVTPRALLQKLAGDGELQELKNAAVVFNGVVDKRMAKYGRNYNQVYARNHKSGTKRKETRFSKILNMF